MIRTMPTAGTPQQIIASENCNEAYDATETARRRHKVNAALLAISEPSERPAVVEVIQAREAAE